MKIDELVMKFKKCMIISMDDDSMYIKIMGSDGDGNNEEVLVGIIIGKKFGIIFNCVVNIILMVKDKKQIITFMGGIFLIEVGMMILNKIGLKYYEEKEGNDKKRLMIENEERKLKDNEGSVESNEKG
jgi:hypothetical protein